MKNDYYGKNHMLHILGNIPVDARPPPPWSKFFQFHAVFAEIWQNCMLATPPEVWRPHLGKSWIRHCIRCYDYIIWAGMTIDPIILALIASVTVYLVDKLT